jgi:peptidoglycan/xylan/chitin deacetylase (PgdA/CDA1 family)
MLRWAAAILLAGTLSATAADRIVYLTFDDGPLNGTSNVLDVLASENVPATMFMVGAHAQANAAILKAKPDYSIRTFMDQLVLLERPEDRELLREGLVKAGLPE